MKKLLVSGLLTFSVTQVEVPKFSVIKAGDRFQLKVEPGKNTIFYTITAERKNRFGWAEIDSDIQRPYTSLPIISPLKPGKEFAYAVKLGEDKPYKILPTEYYRFVLNYGYTLKDFNRKVYSQEFKIK